MGAYVSRIAVWAVLLGLLALSVAFAFAPLGPFRLVASLLIAAAKAGLIYWVFMGLRKAGGGASTDPPGAARRGGVGDAAGAPILVAVVDRRGEPKLRPRPTCPGYPAGGLRGGIRDPEICRIVQLKNL